MVALCVGWIVFHGLDGSLALCLAPKPLWVGGFDFIGDACFLAELTLVQFSFESGQLSQSVPNAPPKTLKAEILADSLWPSTYCGPSFYYKAELAPDLLADTALTRTLTKRLANLDTLVWAGFAESHQNFVTYDESKDRYFGLTQLAVFCYAAQRYQGRSPTDIMAGEAGVKLFIVLMYNELYKKFNVFAEQGAWLRPRLGTGPKAPFRVGLLGSGLWQQTMPLLVGRTPGPGQGAQLDAISCQLLLALLTRVLGPCYRLR